MSLLRVPLRDRAVVVTGGTQGIGRAIGVALARHGARVYLTYRWGSVPEAEVLAAFAAADARPPVLVESDAAHEEDGEALIARVVAEAGPVHVLVSNVSFARVGPLVETWRGRDLLRAMDYGAWPLVGLLQACKREGGRYPRYTLLTSSDGRETAYPDYGYVAAAKAVGETLVRYLAVSLWPEGARVNTLRSRPVATAALAQTFGEDFEGRLRERFGDSYFIDAEEVGKAALAMCSGLLDGMTGQVLTLDRGVAFTDNHMHRGAGVPR